MYTERCKKIKSSESGLTLVQVAIALMVAGLLLVPVIQMYNVNKIERKFRENNKKLEDISIALNKYAQQNKRYPLPAVPTQTPSDSNYGEVAAASSAACTGFLPNGINCVSGDAPNTALTNEVLIGTVPFRALGLKEENAYDMNGSKITYAVTRELVDSDTFKNTNGAIGIRNQNGTPLNGGGDANTKDATNRSRVLFAVISHGADRKGAYQKNGTLSSCAIAGQDQNNCNRAGMTGLFRGRQKVDPTNSAILTEEISKGFSLGIGSEYYDDTISYRTTANDEFWAGLREKFDAGTEEASFSSAPVWTAIVAPKISYTEQQKPRATLDVEGSVQVRKAMTQTICDQAEDDSGSVVCFRMENLTAPEPGLDAEKGVKTALKCENETGLVGLDKDTETDSSKYGSAPRSKLAQTQKYISKKCDDISRLPAGSPVAASINTCPNGIRGWISGSVVCQP